MINFNIRSSKVMLFPQLKVHTLKQGLEACEFCASVFYEVTNWSAIISPTNRSSKFPTIHFQCNEGGMFLQFYADEEMAVNAEEGWFTLSQLSEHRRAEAIIPSELVDNYDGYFDALFADGVSISKEYLCCGDEVIEVLKKMKSSPPGEWFAHGRWHNLGLI